MKLELGIPSQVAKPMTHMPHPNRFTAACGLKGTSASWPEVRLPARPEVRLRSHVPKVSKSTKACRTSPKRIHMRGRPALPPTAANKS
jgi:hypothetical protein